MIAAGKTADARPGLGRRARVAISRRRGSASRQRLLDGMPHGSVCAEIGVWKGDFSALILERVAPTKLHLIDPWRFESDEVFSDACYGGGGAAKNQRDMDRIFESIRDRFSAEIASDVVEVHRETSNEAASRFPANYFDWIYIDGNHLYEFVIEDLNMYESKVKPEGIIAGDDYGLSGWWNDGVTRAVDEFAAAHSYRLTRKRRQFALTRR